MDCLFCKIVAGEIPSSRVYEDDKILAFPILADGLLGDLDVAFAAIEVPEDRMLEA